jgi:hypothetical protein
MSKGCVHTHQGMFIIEGWGSPSCVWNVLQKIWEDNWKARKISWIVSQMLTPGPEQDKI